MPNSGCWLLDKKHTELLNNFPCRFLDDIPFYLAALYEELHLDMPTDLKHYQSQQYQLQQQQAPAIKTGAIAATIDNFADEGVNDLDMYKLHRMPNQVSIRLDELLAEVGGSDDENKGEVTNRSGTKRLVFVPETPPEKLLGRSEQSSQHPQTQQTITTVVKQTPIGKIPSSLEF